MSREEMSIPDFQSFMLPLLRFAVDQQEHSLREAIESLAQIFQLSEQERKELLPSGQQAVFDNRVSWASTHLKKAGLLESPRRSYFKITKRGLDVLNQNPTRIDIKFLEQYPEFVEFRGSGRKEKETPGTIEVEANGHQTPEELLEYGYQKIRQDLTQELLNRVKASSPSFFEKLVVELLVSMGYGGSRKDAGEAVGKSGDEGIDGIIKEDRLGLDVIYIQAKRWENIVGRPEIQKFVGALHGQGAKKGIFITTSGFTKEAKEFVTRGDSLKIVLIDGQQLAQLMIDFDVGVAKVASYEIKKLDFDYFVDV
jgi:restriction system protein